jgi:hypothetical protein
LAVPYFLQKDAELEKHGFRTISDGRSLGIGNSKSFYNERIVDVHNWGEFCVSEEEMDLEFVPTLAQPLRAIELEDRGRNFQRKIYSLSG